MPCCWPPTAAALTSPRPPAASTAARSVDHQDSGSTSVRPGGVRNRCGSGRPSRRPGPPLCTTGSRSRSLQRAPPRLSPSADAEEMLDGQALDPSEPVAALTRRLEVKVLVGRPVAEKLLVALAGVQRRLCQLSDLGGGQRLLHLGIRPKAPRPLAQAQVELHVRERRLPHTFDALGAQRLVVEVSVSVVR